MSSTVKRAAVSTISVQAAASLDGQGRPSYGAATSLKARVVREINSVRNPSGEQIGTAVTCYIPAGQSASMPNNDDQVTCPDGFVGIVVERKDENTIAGVSDHTRIRLREK